MSYRIYRHIRTPEDLGIAHLGDPRASVAQVSSENRVDRAEYGRILAEMEGGKFTPLGYIVPVKKQRRKHYAA